jgi:virginiamycin B lyase
MSTFPMSSVRRVAAAWSIAVACALLLAASASAANVVLHDIPTASSKPTQIVAGPDGRLWFTQTGVEHQVGRFDPASGQFAPIALANIDEATADEGTVVLAPSTNGYVWALDNGGQELYRITAAGAPAHVLPYGGQGLDGLSSYDNALEMPDELVPAAGGGVWTLFSHHNPDLPGNDYNGATIIGDDGSPHLLTNQLYENPHAGALDPADGSLWFADYAYVTRVGSDGAVRRLPTGLDATYDVSSAAIGPDGALWFTAYVSGSWFTSPREGVIGHVVGNQVQVTKTSEIAAPTSLRLGPDGALWWAERLVASAGEPVGAIGRLNPATGAVQEGSLGNYKPASIAFAANGSLWFVDTDANVLGQIGVDGALFPSTPAPPGQNPPPIQNPTPAPTPKPTAVRPAVASKSLRVRDHRVAVVVSCPKAASATCRGAIRLQTATKVKLKGHQRKAIVTLASRGSYAAKPGHKTTVKLKLTKAARAVARHGRSVRVSVQLTPNGARQPAVTARLTLRG